MNGEKGEAHGRPKLGPKLERARKERDLSLEEVEQAIKVHAHHLRALELEDFEALPNPAWAHGFLVMYAKHLGLSEEELGLHGEASAHRSASTRSLRLKRSLKKLLGRRRTWAAALGMVVLAAMTVVAVMVAPYNVFTGGITDFFARVAPGLFLDSGPQRVAIFGSLEDEVERTDAVMLAKVSEKDLGLLTIPRNTLTEIPGDRGTGDFGYAFATGGPDLTRRTVARFAGTEVPYHLAVDAQGLEEIVEAMGGVRYEVTEPISIRASEAGPAMTLLPGPQTLNGDQAVAYYLGVTSANEGERAKRQLDFLYAMYRQALGPWNLLSDPTTLGAVLEHTETNISLIQTIQLVGRVRASGDAGVPMETGTVPGRGTSASSEQGDVRGDYWIPDEGELPAVLEDTVR